jgi:hypothetical protein
LISAKLMVALATPLCAADSWFVGGHVGVATLSADAVSSVGAPTVASSYKPENGLAWMVFAGRHFSDWVSAQATFGGNRNDLLLTSIRIDNGVETSYEQARRISMQTFAAEAMVYFRPRASALRPYLSAGPGAAHSSSRPGRTLLRGQAQPPPEASRSDLAVRFAVGMDVRLPSRLRFRYSFGETIQRNPVSRLLSPRGDRNLANFQNLFGFLWQF